MPLEDYGAIMRSGASLVPDYAQQRQQDELLAIRRDETEQRRAALAAKVAEAQQQLAGEQAYKADLTAYLANPTAEAANQMMAKYPQHSEALKRGWDAADETRRNSDLRQGGAIATRLSQGDRAGAAAELRNRIAADKAADGTADPDDERMLAMIESEDPAAHKMALGLVSSWLIANGGERGKALVSEILPKVEGVVVDDILVDRNTGTPIAQSPYPKIIAGPDGSFFEQPLDPSIPTFGGRAAQQPASPVPVGSSPSRPSVPAKEAPAPKLSPVDIKAATSLGGQFGTVTSTVRTAEHNRKVGGVPNSWHTKGRAIDIARKPGVSHAQVVEGYKRAGWHILEQLDEGDHSHIAFSSSPPSGGPGIKTVRSIQEARALPPGTTFRTPDGRLKVR